MSNKYINDGRAVRVWGGFASAALLHQCAHPCASQDGCASMSFVAALMDAGEAITLHEWERAYAAYIAIEQRAIAAYVGPVKLNRYGQPHGGRHPALGE